ncbi:isoaspartyl aminopeptidase [Obelidium mucronatum]|nr:isoaspartyl aminopeptidase [Obelidium mucronatum]
MKHPVLVIHGGAGIIQKDKVSEERRALYLEGLRQALYAGFAVLNSTSGNAIDAVAAAVASMEDNPLFNAGKGAVFTRNGTHRLDASIMEGSSCQVGAVTQLSMTKNPIELAKLVLKHQPNGHCFLAGHEGEQFGASHGLISVDQEYFATDLRRQQHIAGLEQENAKAIVSEDFRAEPFAIQHEAGSLDSPKGTVGAVALDSKGNLAAATSTGGMTNKYESRIGDTPIIGAGTYAENGVVAVSATGDGEKFIRACVSYDVAAQMKYGGKSVVEAAECTLKRVEAMDGNGGLIALDSKGNISMANSSGMFRGWIDAAGVAHCAIFVDDEC